MDAASRASPSAPPMERTGSAGATSRSRFRKETEFLPGSPSTTMSGAEAATATATGSNAGFPGLYQAVYEGVIPFGAAIRPSVSPSSRFHRIPAPTKAYRRTFRSDRNAPINSAHCCSEYPTRKTYRYRAYSCRTLSVISAVAATGTREHRPLRGGDLHHPHGLLREVRAHKGGDLLPGNQPQRLRLRHVHPPLRVADDDRHPLSEDSPFRVGLLDGEVRGLHERGPSGGVRAGQGASTPHFDLYELLEGLRFQARIEGKCLSGPEKKPAICVGKNRKTFQ